MLVYFNFKLTLKMKVNEIMTKNVETVKEDDLVTKARAIMRNKGYRAMPVIDKNNRMVGIIGRTDALRITSTKSNLLVKGLMRHPIVGFEDEDMNAIAKRMINNSVKQIVIVDKKDQNKILGIVSALDILSVYVNEEYIPKIDVVEKIMKESLYCIEEDEVSKIGKIMLSSDLTGMPVVKVKGKEKKIVVGFVTLGDLIKGGYRVSEETGKQKKIKIKNVMKALVKYVTVNERVSETAKLMVKNRILRVPVVDNEKTKNLKGIVDIEEMLRAYL